MRWAESSLIPWEVWRDGITECDNLLAVADRLVALFVGQRSTNSPGHFEGPQGCPEARSREMNNIKANAGVCSQETRIAAELRVVQAAK